MHDFSEPADFTHLVLGVGCPTNFNFDSSSRSPDLVWFTYLKLIWFLDHANTCVNLFNIVSMVGGFEIEGS